MARAWTLISISDRRQYGGNLGYLNEIEKAYPYDSSVGNHLRIAVGDLIFVRDRQKVFGMARIERIETSKGEKTRLRCPDCGTPAIKERRRLTPKWRCKSGHTFAQATREYVDVTAFRAHYANTFVDLGGDVSVGDLKGAAPKPNDQASIEEVDASLLGEKIVAAGSAAGVMLAEHLQATRPDRDGYQVREEALTQYGEETFKPAFGDTRKRINRSILLRRGQRTFRKKLIRRYGPACLISGCALMDIVEAAHIWPYRGEKDNHPDNGLLLRADLHTLFDLDLLGINPEGWIVRLHPDARLAGYDRFDRFRLRIETGRGPPITLEFLCAESRWLGQSNPLKEMNQRPSALQAEVLVIGFAALWLIIADQVEGIPSGNYCREVPQ